MIKVLVADDSAFMRRVITELFEAQPDFQVLDTARTGKEAVEKAVRLKPDLLTLDVNMPVMDGLAALEVIMKDFPLPVVMISSLTREGSDTTIRALGLGAVDFICKPDGAISKLDTVAEEVLEKCRVAAAVKIIKRPKGGLAVFPPPLKKTPGMVKVPPLPKQKFTATRKMTPLTRSNVRQVVREAAMAGRPASGRLIVLGCSTGLNQWPVQIKLLPVNAPYFDGANLLVAADCTAYAGRFYCQPGPAAQRNIVHRRQGGGGSRAFEGRDGLRGPRRLSHDGG
mgnify:CR=1 FL=1